MAYDTLLILTYPQYAYNPPNLGIYWLLQILHTPKIPSFSSMERQKDHMCIFCTCDPCYTLEYEILGKTTIPLPRLVRLVIILFSIDCIL